MPGGEPAEVLCPASEGRRGEGQASPAHKFTWEELSRLNERHNAHVAVRGKVYDVSGFIEKHPGGVDQILLGAGRDITILFQSYHDNFYKVFKVLEKYYVGELISNELPVYPEPNEFHRTVKKRVYRYFRENNLDPKNNIWMYLRCAMLFLVANGLWIMTIYLHSYSVWLSVLLAVVWGQCASLLFINISHDISHFAVTHKPWVWKLLGLIHDCMTGMSILVWTYQHVVGHHPHTNVDQVDPDVYSTHDPPDIRRIHTSQKQRRRYYYQHLYLLFLYGFVGVKKKIQDFIVVYEMKNLTIRMNPLTRSQLASFIVGKSVYFLCYLVLPSFFMHWALVVILVVLGDIVGWFWVVVITQLSHVSRDVLWPKPDKDNFIDMDWAEMQVATAQDYCTDSFFWTFVSGGLNNQIAHHLFPWVLQSHLPRVSRIVQQTCHEFNVPFKHSSSAWEALKLHFTYLRQRGQEMKED